jgi:hypothetical protein
LPKTEAPLADDAIQHHAQMLPSDLRQYTDLSASIASLDVHLQGQNSRADVRFIEGTDRDHNLELLASAVRTINLRTAGLCFVIDVVKQR